MPAYAEFAGFYDQIMGDRTVDVARMRSYITRFSPEARTLLELGCGTGAMLAGLTPGLEVTGVDRSPEMLAVAARTAPAARLVEADMTAFSLGTSFDVVICVFDTLNHLPRLADWRAMFDRVHDHLADGGLFVFDVNTTQRLRRLWQGPAFASDFGEHSMIMDVQPAACGEGANGEGGEAAGELSLWTVKIFERVGDDMFRLHEERIPELGVPVATIREALAPHFDLLDATGLDGEPASDESSRAFFAYRHRSSGGR
ncbi:MAG TPA: class I SAM-dependent methyltransferase [Streptosporangiaceae bacterium]|nr:class I SAM-dependent methyltransferase [Streptosporangiaceae bacterium]